MFDFIVNINHCRSDLPVAIFSKSRPGGRSYNGGLKLNKMPFAGFAGFVAFLLLTTFGAHGESLPDPTRPPLAAETPGSPSGTGGVAGEAPSAPGLQSILLSPGYKAAIIDGRQVRLGGKIGDAKVVEIRAGEVVLQKGKQREVLKLYPTIRKAPFYRKKKIE